MTCMVTSPYIIRKDGTLLDRKSETTIGRVWLTPRGWVAENDRLRFEPYGGRKYAARAAWEDWRKRIEP